jgi:hypothetical protein
MSLNFFHSQFSGYWKSNIHLGSLSPFVAKSEIQAATWFSLAFFGGEKKIERPFGFLQLCLEVKGKFNHLKNYLYLSVVINDNHVIAWFSFTPFGGEGKLVNGLVLCVSWEAKKIWVAIHFYIFLGRGNKIERSHNSSHFAPIWGIIIRGFLSMSRHENWVVIWFSIPIYVGDALPSPELGPRWALVSKTTELWGLKGTLPALSTKRARGAC